MERIVKSKHTADEFIKIMQRMSSYTSQSTPLHPQLRPARRVREAKGDAQNQAQQKQAAF